MVRFVIYGLVKVRLVKVQLVFGLIARLVQLVPGLRLVLISRPVQLLISRLVPRLVISGLISKLVQLISRLVQLISRLVQLIFRLVPRLVISRLISRLLLILALKLIRFN